MNTPTNLREERRAKARAILRNEQFLVLNPEKQQAILNTLLAKGLQPIDLQILLNERHNESNDPFRILDKGVLTQILFTLDPRSIIALCSTDKRYFKLCRDQNLFRRLLALHYPLSFPTDNPRQQYLALTLGVETLYRMDRIRGDFTRFENPVQIAKSGLPENLEGWSVENIDLYLLETLVKNPGFDQWLLAYLGPQNYEAGKKGWIELLEDHRYNKYDGETIPQPLEIFTPYIKQFIGWTRLKPNRIRPELLREILDRGRSEEYRQDHDKNLTFVVPGNRIPLGTEAWALIWQTHTALMEDSTKIYKSREDLAREFVKNNYEHFLDTLKESYEDYIHETQGEEAWEEMNGYEISDATMTTLVLENKYLTWRNIEIRPFTEEILYEYLLTHDEFHLDPSSERNWWLIRRVTF